MAMGSFAAPEHLHPACPPNHICSIRDAAPEDLGFVTSYIRQGVRKNERVVYIQETHSRDLILEHLGAAGLDAPALLASGQLRILTPDETYLQGGAFDPHAMIELLRASIEEALRDGYTGLRGLGEATWILRGAPGCYRLVEYEHMVNEVLQGAPATALCLYDARRFSPDILTEVARAHAANYSVI
jgi:KaiC/GvpD/RAD55 family RecA-like ATPase